MGQIVVIRANLSFAFGPYRTEYHSKRISVFGCSGLPWPPFDPAVDFGKTGTATIGFLPPLNIKEKVVVLATILREATMKSTTMSLKFLLKEPEKRLLTQIIETHGEPENHQRIYPRLPINDPDTEFPVRATVQGLDAEHFNDTFSAIFRLEDVNPSGVLLSSEEPNAFIRMPGQKVKITLNRGGKSALKIFFIGIIRRSFDELSPETDKPRHFIGIQITEIDPDQKELFYSAMKQVLLEFKDIIKD